MAETTEDEGATARYLLDDLSEDISEQDLGNYFSAFGIIEEITLRKLDKTQKIVGSVKFSSPTFELRNMMLRETHVIKGCKMDVQTWKMRKMLKPGYQESQAYKNSLKYSKGKGGCEAAGGGDAKGKRPAGKDGKSAGKDGKSAGKDGKSAGKDGMSDGKGACWGGKGDSWGGKGDDWGYDSGWAGAGFKGAKGPAGGGAKGPACGDAWDKGKGCDAWDKGKGCDAWGKGKGCDAWDKGKGCDAWDKGKGWGDAWGKGKGWDAWGDPWGKGKDMYGWDVGCYGGYGAWGDPWMPPSYAGPYGMGPPSKGCAKSSSKGDAGKGKGKSKGKDGKRFYEDDGVTSRFLMIDMPSHITEEELREYWIQYGELEDVSIKPLDPTRGMGSVKFAHPTRELRHIALNQTHYIRDVLLTVQTWKMQKMMRPGGKLNPKGGKGAEMLEDRPAESYESADGELW